jgi:sulfopyruvate decarboxylase subunit alpha
LTCHLPLLIFANTRSGLAEHNSTIHPVSQPMPAIPGAAGPPVEAERRSSAADWRHAVK